MLSRTARFIGQCALLGGVWLLSACTSLPPLAAQDATTQACREWFAALDAQIDAQGVRDAQDHRLPGFAQLRLSRFDAALRPPAAAGEAAFQAWLARLQARGSEGHAVELANLPGHPENIGHPTSAAQRTLACANTLTAADLRSPGRRAWLLAHAAVPDAYATAARVAGLYAITRLPFSMGVLRWQEDTLAAFARPTFATPFTQRYMPPAVTDASAAHTVAQLLREAPRDALGLPQLSPALQQQLLHLHAPVFEVAQAGAFDHIGTLALNAQAQPVLRTEQPTLYHRLAFTRVAGQTLVQLVYLAWFAERPQAHPFDLLSGKLDGLIWRVTLNAQGEPLLYDSIHACGCYHLFFPTAQLAPRPAPEPGIEWAFSPAPAPALAAGERVLLRLETGTHYLTRVSATAAAPGLPYALAEETQLRSLPWQGGARRSLYQRDGLIAGTERGERWLFWPMGVRDAGAQRQWGHHATAFVGRRHFDDADLIDLRFTVTAP